MQDDNAQFESAIQAVSNAVAEALKLSQPANACTPCGDNDCKSDANVKDIVRQAFTLGFNQGRKRVLEEIPYEFYTDFEEGGFRFEGDIPISSLQEEIESVVDAMLPSKVEESVINRIIENTTNG